MPDKSIVMAGEPSAISNLLLGTFSVKVGASFTGVTVIVNCLDMGGGESTRVTVTMAVPNSLGTGLNATVAVAAYPLYGGVAFGCGIRAVLSDTKSSDIS